MSRPRVVILGAGLMGRWHAHYARAAAAKIVAVVDTDGKRAETLAKTADATAFTDAEDCLVKTKCEIVHVCTSEQHHVAALELAIRHGKHVLIEKPVCPDAEQAERLLSEAERQNLKVCAVHQFPFQDGFLKLLDHKDELGDLVRLQFLTCSAGGAGKTAEERRLVLLGIVPHPFSLFCRLLPERLSHDDLEPLAFSDDDLEIGGNKGDTRLSAVISMRGRPTRNELLVVGTKGSALLDLFHGYVVFESGPTSRLSKMMRPFKYGSGILREAGGNLLKRAIEVQPAYPGLGQLIERFYQAVEENAPSPVPKEEIVEAARLSDKIRTVKYPGHRSALPS